MNQLNQRIYDVTTRICPEYSKNTVPYYLEDIILILDLKQALRINTKEVQENGLISYTASISFNDKEYINKSFIGIEQAIVNLMLSIPIKDLE